MQEIFKDVELLVPPGDGEGMDVGALAHDGDESFEVVERICCEGLDKISIIEPILVTVSVSSCLGRRLERFDLFNFFIDLLWLQRAKA